MKRSLVFALAIVLFGACSTKEIDMKTPIQDDVMFYASFEQPVDNDTKVYVNEDMLLRWTADDRVSIFNKLTYNQEYMFTGQTGANAGGFKKVDNDEFVTGNAISHVVSVYPYQEATTITENEVLSVTLPSEQIYAEHTFGLGANTMVSVSEDNVLQFKAVGGYLVFKLYGAGVSVSSVTLKGNNDEPLAGQATVATSLFDEPSLAMDEGGFSPTLTLTCTSPVALGATAEDYTEFWFVLPPTSFTKGFTIVVTGPNGGTFEKSTEKPITIERNKLTRMAAIEVMLSGASVPPDNEIWYTSVDGSVISMYGNYLSEFGANLVSNTYENDKGVFVFDGDITAVARYAFNQSANLKTIALPESVTVIGSGAFQTCVNLEHIYLPDSITTIGSAAFNNCRNLRDVTLPKNLVTIEEAGFSNCSSITSIILPDGFTVMDSRWSHNVFGGCSSLEHFGGKFASEDGRCIIMNHVVRSFAPAGLTTYKVPDGVEEIGCAAFENSRLTSLQAPESLSSIGDYAFMYCSELSSFTIPSGVRHLGKSAFSHCTSLPRITLPDRLEDIGVTVFMNCQSLESIEGPFTTADGRCLIKDNVLLAVASKGISSFIVPEGVESISESVFMFLPEIVSVSIPQSVTRIGPTVFRYCDNLASVVIWAQNPPTASYGMFEGTDMCSIYVPASSIEAYKTAQYWSDYADRIQAIPSSSVPIPEAVDLGLSVKWASFNLGASAPEEYGDYFAWGETEPYYISQDPLIWKKGKEAGYDWASYKWCMGDENTMTKYCSDSEYGYNGFTDTKTVLDPEDDAASVNLGGNWRMPTHDEWLELRSSCTWTWTTQNGVNGRQVTGPNGNSIFLPAAGEWLRTVLAPAGSAGNYWSSSLYSDRPNGALYARFFSGNVLGNIFNRYYGFSVRPVYAE